MTIKMDQKMIIVCSVIGSLGVLSAILGFSAEGTKLTILDVYVGLGVCLYPRNPALGLGVCAAIFLVVAQIIFAALGGCCGCCKSRSMPSGSKRIIGVVCAVFSWIVAAVAFGLLVVGAAGNATGAREPTRLGYCYIPDDGILAGGAALSLVATALGITSYVMLRKQPATVAEATAPKEGEQTPAGAAGISTGQPQFPQQPPQGQTPPAPTNYPEYSAPPQGKPYDQAPNPHYPPPPAQGYGAHAPNHHQQQLPPPTAEGYGELSQQYPPPSAPATAQLHGGPHTPPLGHEQV
ncbi:cleavage and polyadenylation specificity factor subunit 6-like [Hordeum vulgare subsp. vulgare]|uniref:Uncharacterized protein n=1 Tax=Hordeum vulgare subsp. vulgare TaxID=112509 RepID=A0A8I6WE74_HORVV|nr:cleavage and polyadenylation specificity factor subunit 6-like [Hordeum vulgare subsp. vulgare]